ncbi:MAG: AMP-binding protein [Ardenticatenaceae bacterium]|nr:AMP-binding protein [Ardenticatenaceae bacterium]
MRIEEILRSNARKFPSRILTTDGTKRMSYRTIDERSTRLAHALRGSGLERGRPIVVALPNTLEFIEAMFAAAKADCVLVPVNPRVTLQELCYVLEDSRAGAALLEPGLVQELVESDQAWSRNSILISVDPESRPGGVLQYEELLEAGSAVSAPSPDRSEYSPWLLAYTSGTTGWPKGAVLTHRSKYLCALIEALEFGTTITDTALINTPLFHVHGLVYVLSLATVGGTVYLMDKFTPEQTLEVVASERITELAMVPTMYQAILDCPALVTTDTSSIRVGRCTAAPLSGELKRQILAQLPDLQLHVLYGATEAGPISNLRPEHQFSKEGSVGQPFLGVAIEIRDDDGNAVPSGTSGEVSVKSPYIFSWYNGHAPKDDGRSYERWITLGDIGRLDSEGFLYLEGRKQDVIISGGENIAAKEVEDAISLHPAVRAVAVVGVSDPYWGERVKAFVELRPGTILSSDELLTYCSGRLARYKHPKEIVFVDNLPRNAMGKIDKQKLLH